MWNGSWLWAYPGPYPEPVPRAPSARERILSRTRHASFSDSVAERIVADLSRRQLVQLWDDTTKLVACPMPTISRLNVVVLRDHLLRRLEAVDPQAMTRAMKSCERAGRG
jgi:hypothetical protein